MVPRLATDEELARIVNATVTAPGSTANLGAGFDCLAVAIEEHLYVTVVGSSESPALTTTRHGEGELPGDESNVIWRSFVAGCEALGVAAPALCLRVDNGIPLAGGFGSSSAAITAGLALASQLVNSELDRDWMVQLASGIEGHPDNVAAAIYGGVVVASVGADVAGSGSRVLVDRLDPEPTLQAVAYVSKGQLLTSESRGRVPTELPIADIAPQLARAARAVLMLSGHLAPRVEGFVDVFHEPPRLAADAACGDAVRQLREAGIATWLSGAGPGIMTLGAPPTMQFDGYRRVVTGFEPRGVTIDQ